MPFQTDDTWTPPRYRLAYAAWKVNAPKDDGPIMPRDAHSASPRHGKLAGKLRSLLTWRSATNPEPALTTSWMRYDLKPDNDNFEFDEPVPQLLDSEIEIRPSVNEMHRAWAGPRENRNVYRHGVAVKGDIAHGVQRAVPTCAASDIEGTKAPRTARRVVTRIGGLRFSNGEQEERCTVLRAGKPAMGRVRMPSGALVQYRQGKTWREPSDCFGTVRGMQIQSEPTVGIGGYNPGVGLCPDPVVDREWSETLRKAVGTETARVLDLAVSVANFKEVGEALGKQGKHAERVGKLAVIDACAKLDGILAAANDNYMIDRRKIA